MVTMIFFCKILLLRQFLSELDDTVIQCSTAWCVYMVLTDSRSGTYDVNDNVFATLGLNISDTRQIAGWLQLTAYGNLRHLAMDYRVRMLPMTSRDRMTS